MSWRLVRITRELLRSMSVIFRRALRFRLARVLRKCLGWTITCWKLRIRCLLIGQIVLGNLAWRAKLLVFFTNDLLALIGIMLFKNSQIAMA